MTTTSATPRRMAGILLHPTSLPGPHGMGDVGRTARRFLDWLAASGLSVWQVLPLNPTSNGSPYMCWSAFAANPLLIDLAGLAEIGLLDPSDLENPPPAGIHVDFEAVLAFKVPRIERAAERLLAWHDHPLAPAFAKFAATEAW